jgi:hypothetical protein
LCQKGIDALTVNNIASTGKFSTYPIYYNFSTIEGLQEQAIDLLVCKLKKSLPVIVDKNTRDIGQAIFRFVKDKPGLVRSFFADKDFYTAFNNKILDLFTGVPASRTELQFNLAVIFS